MKLKRIKIINAPTCGGLLDNFELVLRSEVVSKKGIDPLCFIGPNGSGKSQLLQIIVEIFQSIWHYVDKSSERVEANPNLEFEIDYSFEMETGASKLVRVSKIKKGKKLAFSFFIYDIDQGEWLAIADTNSIREILPKKIVGYTSGDNETLSLPFYISRSGYADDVSAQALRLTKDGSTVADTHLSLMDYNTNLELVLANYLSGEKSLLDRISLFLNVKSLKSFRCIIQLKHPEAPGKTGILLTEELSNTIETLKNLATSVNLNEKTKTYILDFLVNDGTRSGFQNHWPEPADLYNSIRKLSMLNFLILPKKVRESLKKGLQSRSFSSKLPEPLDEHKVFRISEVKFHGLNENTVLDYASLSDGEHQLMQVLSSISVASEPRTLFILDEPDSHFNPVWRTQFISIFKEFMRTSSENNLNQECIITTHAPFLCSDLDREKILIFKKQQGKLVVTRPSVQTFGTSFDRILDECFGVTPPISKDSKSEINSLLLSDDPQKIRNSLHNFGPSVEQLKLLDRIRQLERGN